MTAWLQALYLAIERRFFHNLSRKLAGNVVFLLLLQGVSFAALWWGRGALLDLLPQGNAGLGLVVALTSHLDRLLILVGGVYVASIISAVFCFYFLRYLIVRPICANIAQLEELAEGGGDLSTNIPAMTCDEIGDLSRSYNAFVGTLRELIGEVRIIGLRIAVDAAKVTHAVDESARGSSEQTTLANEIVASSEESTRAIESSSLSLQNVADSTEKQLQTAQRSSGDLLEVAARTGSIAERTIAFRDTVEKLNSTCQHIEGIVSLVEDISDQTNLLALNAAIEAARAGEHGRGFAVVADEVRKLAEKVKTAAGDIGSNVRSMNAQAQEVLSETVGIGTETAHIQEEISQTSQTFREMVQDFEASNSQLLQISAAMEQLAASNMEVHQRVSRISDLSTQVSEGMAVSGTSAAQLNQTTEALQVLVANFRLGQGAFETVLLQAQEHRRLMGTHIAELHDRGVDVFDERYQPLPDTEPPKYQTAFTEAFQRELQPLYEDALHGVGGALFALCVDRNGYAPTHNVKFAQPPTGDAAVDLLTSRDRRMFTDSTGLRAAHNEDQVLLQTYLRDTGEVMHDLSLPIRVQGRHWGALRFGLDPAALMD